MTAFKRGDRVRLISTSDPHTRLRPGALGTVSRVTTVLDEDTIWVAWDDGSRLGMLPAEGDQINLVDPHGAAE